MIMFARARNIYNNNDLYIVRSYKFMWHNNIIKLIKSQTTSIYIFSRQTIDNIQLLQNYSFFNIQILLYNI